MTENQLSFKRDDRYMSLKLIPWWDQQKVANARVMVVGAGALGNEVLKNLALVGTGYIFVVDFDVVEAANLTRSVLFRTEDIGQSKAKVAAQRLKEINPDVRIAFFHGDITTDVGLGVFCSVDVIIAGVDNFAARIFINRACWKVGKPWINGGIQELTGEFHVYIPGQGACYECNLPHEGYKAIRQRLSCLLPTEEVKQGKVPTTPTVASIVGGIQVQEALKLLHGKEVSGGSGLAFNGLTNEYLPIYFPSNEKCLNHSQFDSVISLDRTISSVTFGELLIMAKDRLGSEAFIELDFDVVLGLSCLCGYHSRIAKRLDKLVIDEFRCPNCGKLMELAMTSIVNDALPSLLDKTLAEVQVPPFHIMTARNMSSVVHFQFDGDKNRVLNFV